jgi:hypothetical protein
MTTTISAPFRLNIWQAATLAEWLAKHDDPADDTLNTAYVTLRAIRGEGVAPTDEAEAVEAVTDAGRRLVIASDGTGATDDYPEGEAGPDMASCPCGMSGWTRNPVPVPLAPGPEHARTCAAYRPADA